MKKTGRVLNVSHRLPVLAHDNPYGSSELHLNNHNNSLNSSSFSSSSSNSSNSSRRGSGVNGNDDPSNIPMTLGENEWIFKSSGNGHLSTRAGLDSLDTEYCSIGWTFDDVPENQRASYEKAIFEKEQCIPVFLSKDLAVGHYDIYCKTVLWPLFHYILPMKPSDGRVEKKAWGDYQEVNKIFAETIARVYRPGDFVWVHDYHLMLVPSMLRALIPDAKIGFFLHIPFPTSEIYKCFANRKEILMGLLGANIAGFQTYSYSRHFLSSCSRLIECETNPKGIEVNGWFVSVGIFPIGIDCSWTNNEIKNPLILERIESLKKLYGDKKIIMSRDKLDPIKGVKYKLLAFERFLYDYPEWRDKVIWVQVTNPRQVVGTETHENLEVEVTEIVSRINSKFGSLHSTPVQYIHQRIPREQYYALLSIADACVITSIREGMNLTSNEFVVCQQTKKSPLIISEFTGAAGSLASAIHINPWDYEGVACAINEALWMTDEEKLAKHNSLYKFVMTHTVQYWCQSFISQLKETASQSQELKCDLDFEKGLKMFSSRKKRLILLDYDGTLTNIVRTPDAAVPSKELLIALSKLSQKPDVHIFIVSGRDQKTLDEWISKSCPNVGLSAEHGSYLKWPGENQKWQDLTSGLDFSWKNDVLPIFEFYTERTPGSFIEQKKSSITWHYRQADPVFGSWQAQECKAHLEGALTPKLPIEILSGKKNLEIRARSLNKGEIVKTLISLYQDTDFVFCAGDDRTDEDMFHSIGKSHLNEKSITCVVGEKKSAAKYKVSSPSDVIKFLDILAKA